MSSSFPIISAGSHITEPPNTYVDHIDAAWRDKAPRLVEGGEGVGAHFVIDGMRADRTNSAAFYVRE